MIAFQRRGLHPTGLILDRRLCVVRRGAQHRTRLLGRNQLLRHRVGGGGLVSGHGRGVPVRCQVGHQDVTVTITGALAGRRTIDLERAPDVPVGIDHRSAVQGELHPVVRIGWVRDSVGIGRDQLVGGAQRIVVIVDVDWAGVVHQPAVKVGQPELALLVPLAIRRGHVAVDLQPDVCEGDRERVEADDDHAGVVDVQTAECAAGDGEVTATNLVAVRGHRHQVFAVRQPTSGRRDVFRQCCGGIPVVVVASRNDWTGRDVVDRRPAAGCRIGRTIDQQRSRSVRAVRIVRVPIFERTGDGVTFGGLGDDRCPAVSGHRHAAGVVLVEQPLIVGDWVVLARPLPVHAATRTRKNRVLGGPDT